MSIIRIFRCIGPLVFFCCFFFQTLNQHISMGLAKAARGFGYSEGFHRIPPVGFIAFYVWREQPLA